MSTKIVKALAVAPASLFILMLVVFLRPTLGLPDAAFSVGIAFAASYGFILVAGLPVHLLLQRVHRIGWGSYMISFLAAMVVVVTILTLLERSPPSPLPNDNSPFAALTLRNGGWALLLASGTPAVAIIASLFWTLAVEPSHAES